MRAIERIVADEAVEERHRRLLCDGHLHQLAGVQGHVERRKLTATQPEGLLVVIRARRPNSTGARGPHPHGIWTAKEEGMTQGNTAEVTTSRFDVQSADGTSLAVWVEGEGPPLVMVHGSLQDHTASAVLVDELRNDVTTFSMDRRGFGASGDAAGYAIAREFEDVVSFESFTRGRRITVASSVSRSVRRTSIAVIRLMHLTRTNPTTGSTNPVSCAPGRQ